MSEYKPDQPKSQPEGNTVNNPLLRALLASQAQKIADEVIKHYETEVIPKIKATEFKRGVSEACYYYNEAIVPARVEATVKAERERIFKEIESRGEWHEINGFQHLCLSPVALSHLKASQGGKG